MLLKIFQPRYSYEFPRSFIEQGGVSCLYNLKERDSIKKLLLGQNAIVKDARAQAILVLITKKRDLFQRYRTTMDIGTFYHGLRETDDKTLLNMLSDEEKAEYGFQTGDSSTNLDIELLKRLLQKRITSRSDKPFSLQGFSLLSSKVSNAETMNFLKLCVEYNNEPIFLSILYVIYDEIDSNYDEESYMRLICELASKRIPQSFKKAMIEQTFRQIKPDIVESLYHCLSAQLSTVGYVARLETGNQDIPKPEFTLQASLHLLDSPVAKIAIQYGLVPDNIIVDFINLSSRNSHLLAYLSPDQLKGINLKTFTNLILGKKLYVQNSTVRDYLKGNKEFQQFLVTYLTKSNIDMNKTNLLSDEYQRRM
jgi:hypothetical protein